MSRNLAISNRKGGSGKTTTAVNIAAALAHRGHTVLLVDADPQAHASLSLGYSATKARKGLYNILTDGGSAAENIVDTYSQRLKLAPGSDLLREFQRAHELDGTVLPRLGRCLESVYSRFDYLVFDTPPTLGLLTLSVMVASKEVYVPMQTHFLGLEGLAEVFSVAGKVRAKLNPALVVKGVIPTFYHGNTRLTRSIINEIRNTLGDIILHPIRENVSLAEAPGYGQSIFQYAIRSNGAADYLALACQIETIGPVLA